MDWKSARFCSVPRSSFGLVGAMAVSTYSEATVLVGLPFWAFRQTLAGHYRARHDRTRLTRSVRLDADGQPAHGRGGGLSR